MTKTNAIQLSVRDQRLIAVALAEYSETHDLIDVDAINIYRLRHAIKTAQTIVMIERKQD